MTRTFSNDRQCLQATGTFSGDKQRVHATRTFSDDRKRVQATRIFRDERRRVQWTCINPPVLIERPVPSQESEKSCICMLGISNLSLFVRLFI